MRLPVHHLSNHCCVLTLQWSQPRTLHNYRQEPRLLAALWWWYRRGKTAFSTVFLQGHYTPGVKFQAEQLIPISNSIEPHTSQHMRSEQATTICLLLCRLFRRRQTLTISKRCWYTDDVTCKFVMFLIGWWSSFFKFSDGHSEIVPKFHWVQFEFLDCELALAFYLCIYFLSCWVQSGLLHVKWNILSHTWTFEIFF